MDVKTVTMDKPALKESQPLSTAAAQDQEVQSAVLQSAGKPFIKQLRQETESESGANVEMDQLKKAVTQINRSLAGFNREVHISVHKKLERIMVKVIDKEENKVIREIPPEKMLDAFATALEMAGILLDEKS